MNTRFTFRKFTAMALAVALFFSLIPVNAARAETAGTCGHPVTDHQTGCNYVPAVTECTVCQPDEAGVTTHGGEGCALAEEVPCTCKCADCLAYDALPACVKEGTCTQTAHVKTCSLYDPVMGDCECGVLCGETVNKSCLWCAKHPTECPYVAPACTKQSECAANNGVHVEGCDLYVAPACTKQAECAANNGVHVEGCDLYVAPTCTKQAECAANNGVHVEGCDLYVAPACTKQSECAANNGVHVEGCDLYVKPTEPVPTPPAKSDAVIAVENLITPLPGLWNDVVATYDEDEDTYDADLYINYITKTKEAKAAYDALSDTDKGQVSEVSYATLTENYARVPAPTPSTSHNHPGLNVEWKEYSGESQINPGVYYYVASDSISIPASLVNNGTLCLAGHTVTIASGGGGGPEEKAPIEISSSLAGSGTYTNCGSAAAISAAGGTVNVAGGSSLTFEGITFANIGSDFETATVTLKNCTVEGQIIMNGTLILKGDAVNIEDISTSGLVINIKELKAGSSVQIDNLSDSISLKGVNRTNVGYFKNMSSAECTLFDFNLYTLQVTKGYVASDASGTRVEFVESNDQYNIYTASETTEIIIRPASGEGKIGNVTFSGNTGNKDELTSNVAGDGSCATVKYDNKSSVVDPVLTAAVTAASTNYTITVPSADYKVEGTGVTGSGTTYTVPAGTTITLICPANEQPVPIDGVNFGTRSNNTYTFTLDSSLTLTATHWCSALQEATNWQVYSGTVGQGNMYLQKNDANFNMVYLSAEHILCLNGYTMQTLYVMSDGTSNSEMKIVNCGTTGSIGTIHMIDDVITADSVSIERLSFAGSCVSGTAFNGSNVTIGAVEKYTSNASMELSGKIDVTFELRPHDIAKMGGLGGADGITAGSKITVKLKDGTTIDPEKLPWTAASGIPTGITLDTSAIPDDYAVSQTAEGDLVISEKPAYTIVIPTSPIDMGTDPNQCITIKQGDAPYTGTASVKLTGEYATGPDGRKSTGFKMSQAAANYDIMEYKVYLGGSSGTVLVAASGMDYPNFQCDNEGKIPIEFVPLESTAKYAGTYTGTIIFEVSVS